MNFKKNIWVYFAFLVISLGIVIFIIYLFQLSEKYNVFGNEPVNVELTGQVGDFMGGIVGSLWTLSSTILFYNALIHQKEELLNTHKQMALQLLEMKSQRKEFEINRITGIIYKQLEIVETKIKEIPSHS